MKRKKQSKSYSAPALEKGLDILELLSNSAEIFNFERCKGTWDSKGAKVCKTCRS